MTESCALLRPQSSNNFRVVPESILRLFSASLINKVRIETKPRDVTSCGCSDRPLNPLAAAAAVVAEGAAVPQATCKRCDELYNEQRIIKG